MKKVGLKHLIDVCDLLSSDLGKYTHIHKRIENAIAKQC